MSKKQFAQGEKKLALFSCCFSWFWKLQLFLSSFHAFHTTLMPKTTSLDAFSDAYDGKAKGFIIQTRLIN